MNKCVLWAALCLIAIGVSCAENGGGQAAALPTGISTLSLGNTFDTKGEYVHVFSDESGELSYVYNDGGTAGPINVAVDGEGKIVRLSWEQSIRGEKQIQEVIQEAERRFGRFLKNKQRDKDQTLMYFEDGSTAYSLTFAGNSVVLTTEVIK